MELALGIIFGLLGTIPVILDYDLYINKIKILIAKDDLICDSQHITFDIISKKKMYIYQTCKIKIQKENAILKLGHSNDFGTKTNEVLKIDNLPIQRDYIQIDEKIDVMTYTIYNKSRGESLILEDSFTAELEESQSDLIDDGCGTQLEFYKCKKLVLHVIFPSNFIPSDLTYTESIIKSGKEKVKIKSNEIKHLASFRINRKQILWTINYPKFKYKYYINWKWPLI